MLPMKILKELPLVEQARQLRHTFVQGADENYYKILTFRLYGFPVPPEFATHETNVEEVNEHGGRTVLVQPLIKRFFREDEALSFHQDLLESFDQTLNLKAPEKKEHKPAEKAAPAAADKKVQADKGPVEIRPPADKVPPGKLPAEAAGGPGAPSKPDAPAS